MRAYSEDLRTKIVQAIEQHGMSKARAARLFSVSLSSVKRYTRMASSGESLEPRKSPGRPRKIDRRATKLLEEDIKQRPAATIAQRQRFLESITGIRPSESTLRRLLRRLGLTRKKGLWRRWSETSSKEPPGGRWSPRRWTRSGSCS